MKLPIKKKYFDQIKSGKKTIEVRDAHITFVCEKTGQTLTKKIEGVTIMPRGATHYHFKDSMGDVTFNKMFDDNFQIYFYLEGKNKEGSRI